MRDKISKILLDVQNGDVQTHEAIVQIMKLIERDKEEEREHNESWSSVERGFK